MNAKAKVFGAGMVAGMVATALVFWGAAEVKQSLTPTEEFVEAKNQVAVVYNVDADDVSLRRYDFDSRIWEKIMDTNSFSSYSGLYPNYVYTVTVDDKEEVLAVVLATRYKENLNGLTICNAPANTYKIDYSYDTKRIEPLYVAQIDVSGQSNLDLNSVIYGIDAEIAK
ncbi:MAG: hypothetical protein IJH12_03430 [Clostridia bacterium]|nr:hypothetical protein [Clostridia bacterium]